MKQPLLIIISGPSCSGKSTLARKISQNFSLPLISKDNLKETIFDDLGWSDREWSKKVGKTSIDLLFYFLQNLLLTRTAIIIESNFKAEHDTIPISKMLQDRGYASLQIMCQCDGQVLLDRFKQRSESGQRHPGHVDQNNYEEFKDMLLRGKLDPLDLGGEVVTFDTTDFAKVDYDHIFSKISSLL